MTNRRPRRLIRLTALAVASLALALSNACRNGASSGTTAQSPGQRNGATGQLRVMSFNIRFGTANDGANSWGHRRDQVLRVMRDSDADLIGLQEALRFQLDEIAAAFPEFQQIGTGRDDGAAKGEYCAILFRRTRFEAVESGQFWLSETPEVPGSIGWGAQCTRVCTWARLRDKLSTETIAFYNTHLDHKSEAARRRGVALILDRIRRQEPGDAVILCGDFNSTESSPAVQSILDAAANPRFIDTFRAANPDATETATFHNWTGAVVGPRIDYIFAEAGVGILLSAGIIRDHDGDRFPSDHFPIHAIFETSRPGE